MRTSHRAVLQRFVPVSSLVAALVGGGAHAQLGFEDVALDADVAAATYGRGAAMVDLDGDGRLDLIAANDGMDNLFFRQKANHRFEHQNEAWGIAHDTRPTWGVLAADFDNDGDNDVYFVNGGFEHPAPNQLLRNDLDTTGQFTDVSSLGDVAGDEQTFGASALDIDDDGLLDIFVANDFTGCRVLMNAGGLVFEDATEAYDIPLTKRNRHTGAGDYNNDGWIDVGVGGGTVTGNMLFRNEGGTALTELAEDAGVKSPLHNFGFVFHDFDNDGWLDVYLPKYQVIPTIDSELYLNGKDGTFTDVTAGSGMTGQDDMGHAVYDLDADGWGEVYIGTGNPSYLAYDLLYKVMPDGEGALEVTDLTESSGITSVGLTRNHGMAFGDYDEDGDIDVYANLGGPSYLFDSIQENALWRNAGNDNAWLGVDLMGVLSNRDGVGARATAVTASGREIHLQRAVGMGFTNTPSPTLHFGLAEENEVSRVEVRWPSGITQTLLSPAVEQRHTLIETGLVLRGTPTIGGTVDIDACGPGGSTVELAYGPNAGTAPLGALGTLLIAPPIFPGPAFTLDDDGRATLTVPVPDAPSLAGQSLVVQAWIHGDLLVDQGSLSNTITLLFE